MDQVRPGWVVNDCDLVLEYCVDDLEKMKNLTADPEWIQTALEGQNDWFIRIGYDTTSMEYGAVINVGGKEEEAGSALALTDLLILEHDSGHCPCWCRLVHAVTTYWESNHAIRFPLHLITYQPLTDTLYIWTPRVPNNTHLILACHTS